MELKDRLKTARKKAGLTQVELAKKTGLSQTAIMWLETGRNKDSKNLEKIAKILNVDYFWLKIGDLVSQDGKQIKIMPTKIIKIPLLNLEVIQTITDKYAFNEILNQCKTNGDVFDMYMQANDPLPPGELIAISVNNLEAMWPPTLNKLSLYEGDNIIVIIGENCKNGDLVLAQLETGITVRQYYNDGGIELLKPLNPNFPIYNKKFSILGRVIKIHRDLVNL